MPINLPTNVLRSFVAIVDSGSMLSASERVFVTQSALSLQVKRLEGLVQRSLFARDGRRLSLTPAGEVLFNFARRILSLHDEAVAAMSCPPLGAALGPGGDLQLSGAVRIGIDPDLVDTLLRRLLATFAILHPKVQIFSRVAATSDLLTLLRKREIDLLLGVMAGDHANACSTAPMQWYGSNELAQRKVVPLALIKEPCCFRESAIDALEEANIPYRIAIEAADLSTLKSSIQSGLAITCRAPLALRDLEPLMDSLLPRLPNVACVVETTPNLEPSGEWLAVLIRRLFHDGGSNALRLQ